MTNPSKRIFILTSSPFGDILILLSLLQAAKLTLQINLTQNQIETLTAKCEATQLDERKQPLFYSLQIDECKVICFMLTTTTPNYMDLYYDQTDLEVHNIDNGVSNCRGYLSYCQDGECKVATGRLEIIIFSAKHNMVENKEYDNSTGDPYVRILIGERANDTEWVKDSFEPIFNSSITYIFENIQADEQIALILKDKNYFVDAQIDKFRTSAGEIVMNNFSGVKRFYPFEGETEFGITALITFVVN